LHDDVADHLVLVSGSFELLTFVLTVSSELLNKVVNIFKLVLSTGQLSLSVLDNVRIDLDEIFVFGDIKLGSLDQSLELFDVSVALVHLPEVGIGSGFFLGLDVGHHAFQHVDDGVDALSHLDLKIDRISHDLLVLSVLGKSRDEVAFGVGGGRRIVMRSTAVNFIVVVIIK